MPEDVPVRINSDLYEKAKQIADARGIKIGEAIAEASAELAPSVSICEEEGFKQELRKMGITPPAETKWLFGFLDNFTPEMLKGSKLVPYAEAREKSKGICSLLPGVEEVIEASSKETTETQVVTQAEPVAEPTSEPTLSNAMIPPETEDEIGAEVEAPISPEAKPEQAEVIEPAETEGVQNESIG